MDWAEEIRVGYELFSFDQVFKNLDEEGMNIKEKFLTSIDSGEIKRYRHGSLVNLGIVCLKLFVSENWTGPELFHKKMPENVQFLLSKEFSELASKDLQCNGEVINTCCKGPGLFWLAYFILVEIIEKLDHSKDSIIWTLRCIAVYQELLDEKSSMLNEKFLSLIENGKDAIFNDIVTEVEYNLECMHLYLQYYGYNKAREHLETVGSILGLNVNLTGSMGKRTKFQQNDLAQLRLEIEFTNNEERDEAEPKIENISNFPTDVALDDDTLLTRIDYTDAKKLPFLKPFEQAYVIAASILKQRTTAKDNLLVEELLPYFQAVTQNPQAWSVQCKALHQRSILESKGSRTVERSMMQMEHIVNEFKKESPPPDKRIEYLHAVALPPYWELQADYARILLSLGCTKSALEIFENIESWENVIFCYSRLGRHEKAENIIREQLDVKETAKLWCLLGDVTNNIEFYEKAWELSKQRSARAQRSLGFWYLRSGKAWLLFEECVEYFQRSLNISSLQPQVWFSLGCASLATKQFDIAQNAFQRYVTIDPDNHEAWNNLSSVFIRTKQKRKAFLALQEALKANYGSWQIWENFLLVAIDLGEFRDVIRAVHNLLELKRKEIDTEVLKILVDSATSDLNDASGEPVSKLIPKIKELFGRMTSQITNNPDIWLSYGDLYHRISETDSNEKALGYYMKAQRCHMQSASWEKEKSKIKKVVETHEKLIQAVQKMISASDSNNMHENQLIASTRMAISNFLKRFDNIYPDGLSSEESELKAKETLQTLRENFKTITVDCDWINLAAENCHGDLALLIHRSFRVRGNALLQ
eukprot:gene20604-22637_t